MCGARMYDASCSRAWSMPCATTSRKEPQMYPGARLDALHDGIFGVAMTLLVLDVRLPDDFEPTNNQDLIHGILGLEPKFLPYALSFLVLGLRWLSSLQGRGRAESFDRHYVRWRMLYL